MRYILERTLTKHNICTINILLFTFRDSDIWDYWSVLSYTVSHNIKIVPVSTDESRLLDILYIVLSDMDI